MKNSLIISALTISMLCIGILAGRTVFSKPTRQQSYKDKIVLVKVGDVDGRPIFNVHRDTCFDEQMYPEEIAYGLNTGLWDYNEDLRITDK
jgi:hypothetical protein